MVMMVCSYQIREHSEKQIFEEGTFWTTCDICKEQITQFLECGFLIF